MKKLLLAITALTLGISIIPVHGAEEKKSKAESESLEAPAAKRQKLETETKEATIQGELSKKLGAAVVKRDVEGVINALDQGANPNIMSYKKSKRHWQTINPAMYFIEGPYVYPEDTLPSGLLTGDAEVAILIALVNHGFDVNESDDGMSLLAHSAISSRTHILQALIDLRADINQPIHSVPKRFSYAFTVGMTPLMVASRQTMMLLLRNGADPAPVDAEGHDIEYHLAKLCSKGTMSNEQKQEILNIIEPYKKAYRDAIHKAGEDFLLEELLGLSADFVVGEDPEQKAIHDKKEAATMDEGE